MEGAQWWRYEGGCWAYSSVERVQASVQKFLTRLSAISPKVAVTPASVRGVLFLAQSLLGPHPLSDFDSNADWIGLRNGVYDTATGKLLPHSPENRLTHQSPFCYDPAATCPRWESFLAETLLDTAGATSTEWTQMIQEWYGYCSVPDVSAQAAMFWVGEGANGKGAATRVLENLVGTEFCTAIPIDQLNDPYYRAELYGKLVGFVDEPDPRAMQKNGSYFKRITGGDALDARRPTERVFKFRPTCRLVVSCNDLPSTRDVSRGYFRRIMLIEWRYNVPEEKRDRRLDDVLQGEMPGIFNWAMAGLSCWKERGRRFNIPVESSRLLSEYKLSEDTLTRFLSEECQDDLFAEVLPGDLYAAYVQWCKASGEHPHSMAVVGRQLGKKPEYTRRVKRAGTRTIRYWEGLSLLGGSLTLPFPTDDSGED